MNDIIAILFTLLIIFTPVILIARWRYKKKVKKEAERRNKLTPEERSKEDQKSLSDIGNTLTVIIPAATLMVVSREFGWITGVWVSIVVFVIGRLLFEFTKRKDN